MLEIPVTEIMQSPVQTIDADESVQAASQRLADHDVGSLVVCEAGTPVGIVTAGDFNRFLAFAGDPGETSVEEMMSAPVVTGSPGDSAVTAAHTLMEHGIKRLPIVEDGQIVGIVTTSDLSNFIPHLPRSGRPREVSANRAQIAVRTDTAYEDPDWEYEYHGNESGIDVGDTVRFGTDLTADDVEQFAAITGDTNRLHLDEEYARKTRFGTRIVHGTLVSGLVSAALARLPGLTIYLSQDVSFLGPVELGSHVTAECTVVESLGTDKFRISTDVLKNGEAVVEGEAVVLSDPMPVLDADEGGD